MTTRGSIRCCNVQFDLPAAFDVHATDNEQRDVAHHVKPQALTMLQKSNVSLKQNLFGSVAEIRTVHVGAASPCDSDRV
jgi:hypothetical protein